MPGSQQGKNYLNNSNGYDTPPTASRRGPNVMQAPETQAQTQPAPRMGRTPAEAPAQGARGSGPNIEGEATTMPESARAGRSDRRDAPFPGCPTCVAI